MADGEASGDAHCLALKRTVNGEGPRVDAANPRGPPRRRHPIGDRLFCFGYGQRKLLRAGITHEVQDRGLQNHRAALVAAVVLQEIQAPGAIGVARNDVAACPAALGRARCVALL